jgi:diacylglycerol kinase (ATP)
MRACLIFNPTARGDKARRLRTLLDSFSAQAELMPTFAAGSARGQASDAVRRGFQTIVAAGGDGTVNEVLNGIVDEPGALENVRLGVLPMGTVNVFAAELKIPFSLPKAWEIVLRGRETKIDLPRAHFDVNGREQHRVFAQMAGAGWDARAVELVNWQWKKRVGQMAYVLAGLEALRGPHSLITATHDSGQTKGELIIVGNGRFYGGRFPLFHQAKFADGLFDVLVFPKVHWNLLPRYSWAFLTGQLFKPGGTEYFQTKTLQLTAPSRTSLQLEGECVGQLPARFDLAREALRVVVP